MATKTPAPPPAVAVLYTAASALSRENEQLAKYLGLCLAAGGQCTRVAVVSVSAPGRKGGDRDESSVAGISALRSDGVVVERTRLGERYKETSELSVLEECALWILVLDESATLASAEKLAKSVDTRSVKKTKGTKRVVLSLQTTMRRLAQLSQAFPDAIVVHGGAGFQVVQDDKGVLHQLSQGCFFIERLAQEKVSALFAVDVLESTGIQALSRRNVQALKWGSTMLRTFYYVNALTGQSVHEGLRDRNVRFIFLQALVEIWQLFELVMLSNAARAEAKGEKKGQAAWEPDSVAATYLPIHSVMVLLPLPNWIFNTLILSIFDFGLADSSYRGHSVTTLDMNAMLQTNFDDEFRDIFELAEGRSRTLPTLEWLKKTLAAAAVTVKEERSTKGHGPQSPAPDTPSVAIRSSVLLSQVPIARDTTATSRTFFLKFSVTIVLTILLIMYLLS